ncbi:VWA domain-containing protein [Peribacillus psychrosaccharolyticus]|uniref:VWA domain-containing protein n=1 Tax=Peribacillus psychrosaccharolyticus TaxID=1407 RepID=A0A974NIU8_PERPY|nr:VWA domain-containing protein [Peribacillus psychrosaccharolyticus]MEC2057639.1 VWA domain-containing protein [Peribacillus psychrosaccharolyticus]MED3744784.1 VWA domain-containing protein [Peribacillus psychrosaccharolyticus]QQS98578.1 VWA domain-containing protein [Peribacillus psychrosaccharolyticus]
MRKMVMIMLGAVLLAGCQDGQSVDKKKPGETESISTTNNSEDEGTKEDEKVEFPTSSTDAVDIVKQPEGIKVKETDAAEKSVMEKFPAENLTNEELVNGLVYWFAMDYSSIDKLLTDYEPNFAEYEGKEQEEKIQNVAIHLDSSGSMIGAVRDGVKMDLAKKAIQSFGEDFPEDSYLSLRTYGHKGNNENSGKKLSCSSTELMYEPSHYDEGTFNEALNKFKPTGWTPLANSVKAGYEDLKVKADENTSNSLFIVSDGIETCGGDPAAAAKELADSDLKVKVYIIGFNVDDEGQKQLKEAAKAGNGKYFTVNSKIELENSLTNLLSEAKAGYKRNFSLSQYYTATNFHSVKLSKEVDELRTEFIERMRDETTFYIEAINELKNQGKIDNAQAESVENIVNERQENVLAYITQLAEEAQMRIKKKLEILQAEADKR